MNRLGVVLVVVAAALTACSSDTNTAARDAATSTTISAAARCALIRDASLAGTAAYYANSPTSLWPATFHDMTTTNPPALELPPEVSASGKKLTGDSWTLSMTGGGSVRPTFTCSA